MTMLTDADFLAERQILPDNVRPVHYSLNIEPNLNPKEDFRYKGQVDIELELIKDSDVIVLNTNELEISKAELKPFEADKAAVGSLPKVTDISYDTELEQATLKLDTGLRTSDMKQFVLGVEFFGYHNDKMAGFYRSQYVEEENGQKITKYMAVTQFEPTDARRAFPCWDEPALKATFDVSLTVDENLTALSNMNDVETSQVSGGKKTVRFARTPIMSTYLVAFVAAELDFVQTQTEALSGSVGGGKSVDVRVFTPRSQSSQGKFALETAKRILEFFSEYFDIAYPLPKMDLVAIPDFAAGAMENWGLVTYRTVYLLFDENQSGLMAKQRIAYVVGHELAHQWFGNVVTFKWWSDLWLNEGFATWAGWLATDHCFPEWKVWEQFVNDDYQRGLSLDSLKSSHPIEVPVKNPAEIHQIFDAISYSKGASVIRMLANYMGQKTFRDGVSSYLKKFLYGNAQTDDLWSALEDAATKNGEKSNDGTPIGQLMKSWTRQTGYPVLSVSRKDPAKKAGSLSISQDRFLSFGGSEEKSKDEKQLWFIPLQVVTSDNPTNATASVLNGKSSEVELESFSDGPNAWIKFNFEHTGFYRTHYSGELFEKIGNSIAAGHFGKSDRIGLLTDVFALSQSGHTSVSKGLELINQVQYSKEMDYVVWSEIASELASVRSVWWNEPESVVKGLEKFTQKIFGELVAKLGWEYADENESHLQQLLRGLAIGVAGKAGDEAVVSEAKRRFDLFFEEWQKQFEVKSDAEGLKITKSMSSQIHPNLRGHVFAIVVKHGTKSHYEKVMEIYKKSKVIDEKLAALGSLGAASDAQILESTLDFGLDEKNVRPQDIIYVVGSVAGNLNGRKIAWPWVKKNWSKLYERYYKSSMSLLSRIVSSTTENFGSKEHYEEVRSFFADKEVDAISRSIEQSLEKIMAHESWLSKDRENVKKWLNSA